MSLHPAKQYVEKKRVVVHLNILVKQKAGRLPRSFTQPCSLLCSHHVDKLASPGYILFASCGILSGKRCSLLPLCQNFSRFHSRFSSLSRMAIVALDGTLGVHKISVTLTHAVVSLLYSHGKRHLRRRVSVKLLHVA